MLGRDHWSRLARWTERVPFWVRWTVIPFAAPLAMVLAGVCVAPWTFAVCAAIAILVYGPLGWGTVNWEGIGRVAPWLYLAYVLAGYLGLLEELAGIAVERRHTARDAKEVEQSSKNPSDTRMS